MIGGLSRFGTAEEMPVREMAVAKMKEVNGRISNGILEV